LLLAVALILESYISDYAVSLSRRSVGTQRLCDLRERVFAYLSPAFCIDNYNGNEHFQS
jgi:hypothetical protein